MVSNMGAVGAKHDASRIRRRQHGPIRIRLASGRHLGASARHSSMPFFLSLRLWRSRTRSPFLRRNTRPGTAYHRCTASALPSSSPAMHYPGGKMRVETAEGSGGRGHSRREYLQLSTDGALSRFRVKAYR